MLVQSNQASETSARHILERHREKESGERARKSRIAPSGGESSDGCEREARQDHWSVRLAFDARKFMERKMAYRVTGPAAMHRGTPGVPYLFDRHAQASRCMNVHTTGTSRMAYGYMAENPHGNRLPHRADDLQRSLRASLWFAQPETVNTRSFLPTQ